MKTPLNFKRGKQFYFIPFLTINYVYLYTHYLYYIKIQQLITIQCRTVSKL